MRRLCLAVAALALAGPACGSSSDGPVPTPTLSDIQAKIFTPTCATSACHGGTNDPKSNPLDLTAGHSFANLVGHTSFWVDKPRVKAGDPDGSFLIEKLASATPQPRKEMNGYTNDQMPSGCPDDPKCVSSKQIAAIAAWITMGAQDD